MQQLAHYKMTEYLLNGGAQPLTTACELYAKCDLPMLGMSELEIISIPLADSNENPNCPKGRGIFTNSWDFQSCEYPSKKTIEVYPTVASDGVFAINEKHFIPFPIPILGHNKGCNGTLLIDLQSIDRAAVYYRSMVFNRTDSELDEGGSCMMIIAPSMLETSLVYGIEPGTILAKELGWYQ